MRWFDLVTLEGGLGDQDMMTKKSRANPQMPVPAVGALDLPCQRHDVTSQHFVRLDEQLCDNPLISLLPESPN